jgi:hypothetical protein
MDEARILPQKHDRDTAGFFEAADRHQLVYRTCTACKSAVHPPRARCNSCGSWDTAWKQVSGRGRLYSWTTVCHQVHPAFPAPYTIFVVELEEAPEVRLVGFVTGVPEVHVGMSMRVRFEASGDGGALPQWEPDTDGDGRTR